jgi:hypothetical protein
MSYSAFSIAIWHPFGPHGLESADAIIERKRREIDVNGWTFWSFQNRRPEVLEEWRRLLAEADASKAFAFCSHSPEAVDPAEAGTPVGTTECRSYRFAGQLEWQPWPTAVRVPHPFRGKKREASAFVVQRVIYPVEEFRLPAVQWFSNREWKDPRIPTRGEYLVRRGGSVPMRRVRAVLELRPPFLATVSANAAQQVVPADGPRAARSVRG